MATFTFVVDDQDPQIQYLCPVTKQTVLGSYFNKTWTTINDPSCNNGWFKYSFRGTQISIVASSSNVNQDFAIQIDQGGLVHPGGRGSYVSPVLTDGEHTLVYSAGNISDDPAFDFLTVTTTSPANRTVIVDDTDFEYTGNWSSEPPASVAFDPSLPPYLNTTHWTNSVGDTISLKFTGSSISVYGILPNLTSTENMTATYIVDGKSTALSLPASVNMVSPMTQFFHADLESGSHNLFINITSVSTHQPIGFDFILYNSTTTAEPSSDTSNKTGLIVGSVLGAIFGLCLILLLLFLVKRKRKQLTDSEWTVVSFKDGEKGALDTPPKAVPLA